MHPAGEQDAYELLKELILSARIPAGTKIVESKVAGVLGMTRERLRKVLRRLDNEALVAFVPNKGTIVPVPSLEDARTVFEARRILEGGVVMRLTERLTDRDLAVLRAHLAAEAQAAAQRSRREFVAISSRFHLLLAELLRNAHTVSAAEFLIARSNLISTFCDPSNSFACLCHEHQAVFEAIERGDGAAAHRAMLSHLSLIETRLSFEREPPEGFDLESLLREQLGAAGRAA